MAKDAKDTPDRPAAGDPPALSDRGPSFLEAAREVGGALWDAGKPMFDHGRDEAAAALFRGGDAHVMYGWGGPEKAAGAEGPAVEPPQTPAREQDRGLEL